jgi:branched-chain amino acid transport system permease protein
VDAYNATAMVAIYSLLALSFFLVLRAGEISFGQQAYFALGAYAGGVCTTIYQWHIVPAILLSALLGGAVAWLVAHIALRLDGIGFSLFTLILAECVREAFAQWTWLTQSGSRTVGPEGAMGFAGIDYFARNGIERAGQVAVIAAAALAVLTMTEAFLRGSFGRKLGATASDPELAEARGLDTMKIRRTAFSLAGLVAGLSGALFAHYVTFIDPQNFGLMTGVHALAYTFLGGCGHVLGAVVGTMVDVLFLELGRFAGAYRMVAFGGAIVLCLIMIPRGIFPDRLTRRS